jgi:NADH dehydrogenase
MSKPRIAIVGSGFAGYHAARALTRMAGRTAEVSLISSTDFFLYLPLLPEVAAGILDPRRVTIPLSATAAQAVRRLGRLDIQERHLYLTLGCTAHSAAAFASLVLAGGVPPVPPPSQPGVSHLWLAPVLGHSVFVWTSTDGWTRHEPYN